jgi:DNA-directed RNA polymerase omega subunit
LNNIGDVDSKFRFVHLASKRAKMLLKGSKPKIKTKSKNPIRIAQTEVREGLVDFEIIKTAKEEVFPEPTDRIILGGGGAEEAEDLSDDAGEGLEGIVDEEEAESELSVEFDEEGGEEHGEDEKE